LAVSNKPSASQTLDATKPEKEKKKKKKEKETKKQRRKNAIDDLFDGLL
jgi:ribosomal protein L12E/L44/L45/RPP1/RPP2